MIIETLCCFPEIKGKRSKKAEETIRHLLNSFRPRLRAVVAAAVVMQTVLLAIPAAVHYWLPRLLDTSADSQQSRLYDLTMLMTVLILVGATRAYANYQFLRLASRLGHLLVAELRSSTYAHLMRLPVHYVESRGAGRVLLRFISDADALRGWFSKSGPKLIADSLTACVIVAALVWIDFVLALVLSLPMILCIYLLVQLSRPVREATQNARRLQSRLSGQVEQDLTHIRSTKIVQARDRTHVPVQASIASVAGSNAERDQFAARLEAWGQSIIFTTLPLLLVCGLSRVWSQQLQSEDFVTFVWLTLHLIVLVRYSLAALVIHQKALVSVQRLYALFARPAEAGRGTKASKPSFDELTIVSKDETIHLGPGIHILPTWICSTQLSDCLYGFSQGNRIEVAINGVNANKVNVSLRRRLIGRLTIGDTDKESWLSDVIMRMKLLGLRIAILTSSNDLAVSDDDLEMFRLQMSSGLLLVVQQTSIEPGVANCAVYFKQGKPH